MSDAQGINESTGATGCSSDRPGRSFVLVGATATGKSSVAQLLALHYRYAIVSADSMQVYGGMDIGTAKVTAVERAAVDYWGIDLTTPDLRYSTGEWLQAVVPAFAAGQPPVIAVGGTGLYLRALLQGLDAPAGDLQARHRWEKLLEESGLEALQAALERIAPERLAALDDRNNPRRLIRALEQATAPASAAALPPLLPPDTPLIGLRLPRPALQQRIRERLAAMYRQGLLAEVEQLRQRWPHWSATAAAAIGYAEAAACLDGKLSRDAAIAESARRTNQLARRQETWFRHQLQVTWIDISPEESPAAIATRVAAAVGLRQRDG